MLYDLRTYTCKAGTIMKQLKLYEEHGWVPQTRHLGKPVIYASTETGDPNKFYHIWQYEDAADRATRRAAMQADPEWQAFLAKGLEAGYLIAQQNTLLVPAPFFDPKA